MDNELCWPVRLDTMGFFGQGEIMRATQAATILCSILCCLQAHTATIRVPSDQPDIQAGIDSASDGDTVLVAPGTYVENIDFLGKAIRVKSEAGAESTVIDGSQPVDPDYGCVVRFISGEGRDSIIEGFTLTGGMGVAIWFDFYYYAEYRFCGGAVYTKNASPTIRNNIMTGATYIDYGGGVYCDAQSPLIRGNTIIGNDALWDGSGIFVNGAADIIDNVITDNFADYGFGGAIFAHGGCRISDNTISGNSAQSGGGLSCSNGVNVSRNVISGNSADYGGGGVRATSRYDDDEVILADNLITDNMARYAGGAYCANCLLAGNIIAGNVAEERGGGLYLVEHFHSPIADNLVYGNSAGTRGGGLYITDCDPVVLNTTIVGNSADELGGGFCISFGSAATVSGSILFGNTAPEGPQIKVRGEFYASTLSIDYSDLVGGQATIHLDGNCTLIWGDGMIDADPIFVTGLQGEYYLSHTAAGQPVDSPCLDGCSPATDWVCGTTRTDGVLDQGAVDMGYHYVDGGRLVAGPGPGIGNPPVVRVFLPRTGVPLDTEFMAYATPRYGVNVSCADLDGDGVDEILTGAGPGPVFGAHVRGFESTGTPVPGVSFFAYGTRKWGVNVCAGDLDGDGRDEIVTGAGPGAVFGPHVRAFTWDGQSVSPISSVSFFAYGTLKWGVNVTAGDLDGDGIDELITGAGPGAVFGPHVRAFAWDGQAVTPVPEVSFLAYGTPRWGVNVAAGDLDGDGMDEIVTAPGPSAAFGADIRGWNVDGGDVTPLPGCSFFAWPPAERTYGARVFAGADLTGDGREELFVASGPDPFNEPLIDVYTHDEDDIHPWLSFTPFKLIWKYGASVAAGSFEGGSR